MRVYWPFLRSIPHSTARKELIWRVRLSIDLNNIANNQLAASSGFHLTVDLNFTALNQHLRMSPRSGNAPEFQELIQSQGFMFGSGIA
jgi:hypothetical protein